MNNSVWKIFIVFVFAAMPAAVPASVRPVTLMTLSGAIAPAGADYVERGIARASRDDSQLIVLTLDTPGGLDTSMRSIIKAILSAPMPVACHVAPGGARAASAGTYILYACHIAAMASGTNLGAATPIELRLPLNEPAGPPPAPKKDDGDRKPRSPTEPNENASTPLRQKQLNDAAAYIRGLAQLRERNADWAERAVREGASLPANEALRLGVIDFLANDTHALLAQLNGKEIRIQEKKQMLQTYGAPLHAYEPDWRMKILAVITDPSIALLLMTIGIYGLLFEFMIPGAVVPGVLGAVCLVIALYGLQLLPVNYAGLALILLGLSFMAAEAFLPSFGALGLGGIAAFAAGALLLIDTEAPGFGVPPALVGGLALLSALLAVTMTGIAVKTRRRATVGGLDDMRGRIGEVMTIQNDTDTSWVRLGGETWHAVSSQPLHDHQKVRVISRKGLVLEVAPVDSREKEHSHVL
ncbi:nodulation protein NfeD [Janthinobacterium sp. 17J80-10]|uniref:NfeD family protein n=1 Tax=Janthinobacterium sp. 17J80-10 TaxID=2497863 RepID=UPI0010056A78|nr:nodulation protein NfeD [Janthinobacterium sp. 17J80-10]QAU35437.1 nodulation protein NfeD [Janthinobacterium sp. 17J80-10]